MHRRLARWRKWRACSFSNLSTTSPTSQLILQPFHRFTYVTAHSPTLLSFLLCHWLFTYRHLASRPWFKILVPEHNIDFSFYTMPLSSFIGMLVLNASSILFFVQETSPGTGQCFPLMKPWHSRGPVLLDTDCVKVDFHLARGREWK